MLCTQHRVPATDSIKACPGTGPFVVSQQEELAQHFREVVAFAMDQSVLILVIGLTVTHGIAFWVGWKMRGRRRRRRYS